jgi:hypothetical protein
MVWWIWWRIYDRTGDIMRYYNFPFDATAPD